MNRSKKTAYQQVWSPKPGQVVGTITTRQSLLQIPHLAKEQEQPDYLELRLDCLLDINRDLLHETLQQCSIPLLLTVRHEAEGGYISDPHTRTELYTEFLSYATLIDIELQFAAQFPALIAQIKEQNSGLILSAHNFQEPFPLEEISQGYQKAKAAGADIYKVAMMGGTEIEFAKLLQFTQSTNQDFSVMYMGAWGRLSRLLLALAGSTLNYGYTDIPNADGQWKATDLKKAIREFQSQSSKPLFL